MTIEAKLRTLTKNEMLVLWWKCKGLTYPLIAKRFVYSVEWVQLQMSRVYFKLGFEKSMHWSKRVKILEEEVCPKLPKNVDDWTPAPKTPTPRPNPEMLALVLYDEQQMAKRDVVEGEEVHEPIVITRPQPTAKTGGSRNTGLIALILVVGLCIGAGITYLALRQIPTPSPTVATHPTTLPVKPAAIPTNTRIPFVPPANGILFQDNFDSGIKADWVIVEGKWLTADGRLTLLRSESSTFKGDDEIAVNNPNWLNYILSVTINTPGDPFSVVVRNDSETPERIGYTVDPFDHLFMSLLGAEALSYTAVSGRNEGYKFPDGQDVSLELRVENDTYILSANGRKIQTVVLEGYTTGGFTLRALCYRATYARCVTFDDVVLRYLP